MKPGDIVEIVDSCGHHRTCVVLMVRPKDLRKGLNAWRPGLHLFRGYWYGSDPMSITSYGKIEGLAHKNQCTLIESCDRISDSLVRSLGI